MDNAKKGRGIGKAAVFAVFIVGSIIILRYTPLLKIINPENIQGLVDTAGIFGPPLFVVIYALGICIFMPSTLFTGLGAVLFGPYYGFVYNILGAMLGATAAFFIGRYLGRDFAASLIGERLKSYDDKIAVNGFAATLYLRLVFFPFTPLNFGMGLTKVGFRDYFLGTLFGIIAGGFAMTFFFATLAEVWASHDWYQLLGWKTFVSLALFVGSFFIPKAARKMNLIGSEGTEKTDQKGEGRTS